MSCRYTSLRANLQACADLGQEAFLEAEGRMRQLCLVANIITADGGAVSISEGKSLPQAHSHTTCR